MEPVKSFAAKSLLPSALRASAMVMGIEFSDSVSTGVFWEKLKNLRPAEDGVYDFT
jgi:hypothetical protein